MRYFVLLAFLCGCKAGVPSADAQRECAPCTYIDARGVYHLVDDMDQVPPKYRKHAGRVRGVVQIDHSRPRRDAPGTEAVAPSRWETVVAAVKDVRARFAQLSDGVRQQAIPPKRDVAGSCSVDPVEEQPGCVAVKSHR
jgi:hypothetical protein